MNNVAPIPDEGQPDQITCDFCGVRLWVTTTRLVDAVGGVQCSDREHMHDSGGVMGRGTYGAAYAEAKRGQSNRLILSSVAGAVGNNPDAPTPSPATPPSEHRNVWCECGHVRDAHTNGGTGSCINDVGGAHQCDRFRDDSAPPIPDEGAPSETPRCPKCHHRYSAVSPGTVRSEVCGWAWTSTLPDVIGSWVCACSNVFHLAPIPDEGAREAWGDWYTRDTTATEPAFAKHLGDGHAYAYIIALEAELTALRNRIESAQEKP